MADLGGKCDDNIKMQLEVTEVENIDWIYLAQNKDL
jgi:hypothetical protein